MDDRSSAAPSTRLAREIEHGKNIAAAAREVWNWESPAGKRRWRRRVEFLTQGLGQGQRVLELGCGTGHLTRELIAAGASVVAIDISPDLLNEAKRLVASERAQFVVDNAYALAQPDASFDAVIGSSVLHHLEIERAVAEAMRVLRPGGWVAFTEPNMLNPQIAVQKNVPWIKRRMGDTPDETAFFKWPLRRLFERTGFVDVRVEPFDFLHPALPEATLEWAEPMCLGLERIPGMREIAGSLMIRARKPGAGDSG